jgi:sec-independent protein translocase protein TatA
MSTYTLAFIGGWEWVIIVLAILLLFGAKKLPELAKGLGKGIREFKKASSDISGELNRASYEEEQERQLEDQPVEVQEGGKKKNKKKKAARAKSSPDSKA